MRKTPHLIGLAVALAPLLFLAAGREFQPNPTPFANPYVIVLGTAQDGGHPQAGSWPKSMDPSEVRHVVCLGLVDPGASQRWMIEATPDFAGQLARLPASPPAGTPGLDGILLTHAHIGHYLGLAQLGHEVMGARQVPVYAMPRMREFLETNGPWAQLVRYKNIQLRDLEDGTPTSLNSRLRITPLLVPHRQEYSEVVGFHVEGPHSSLLFIPDIDSWEEWDTSGNRVEDWISRVDRAYLDGTFYEKDEIPGRDMSGFPHPFITHTLKRFADLPGAEKAKVHFIHLNHTNPVLNPASEAAASVRREGFRIAEEGEVFGL